MLHTFREDLLKASIIVVEDWLDPITTLYAVYCRPRHIHIMFRISLKSFLTYWGMNLLYVEITLQNIWSGAQEYSTTSSDRSQILGSIVNWHGKIISEKKTAIKFENNQN